MAVNNFAHSSISAPLKIYTIPKGAPNGAKGLRDGKKIRGRDIKLKPGEQTSVIFEKVDLKDVSVIHARLDLEDDLACDNDAWLALTTQAKLRVCLTGEQNPLLHRTLEVNPLVEIDYHPHLPDVKARNYDLYIFNNALPGSMARRSESLPPHGRLVVINPPNDFGPFRIRGKIEDPEIVYTDPNSPLLAYVDFKDFHIWQTLNIEVTGIEKRFFQRLVASGQTPLIGEWKWRDRHLILIAFDLAWRGTEGDTDWSQAISFPIFWANLIKYFASGIGISEMEYIYYRTGRPTGLLSFIPDKVGLQEIGTGDNKKTIAVNLADETESNNEGASQALLPDQVPHKEAVFVVYSKSIIPWLVFAGLALLILAWWLERKE